MPSFVQRISVNGNSAVVTLCRKLLFSMGWKPGDFLELTTHDDGSVTVRPWGSTEHKGTKSPGEITRTPEAIQR